MSKVSTNRRALDRLMDGMAGAMDDVKDEVVEETATFMRQRVHVLTGETRGSIRTNKQEGTVSADYGAIWEVQRGGSHDFMTPSFNEALSRAGDKMAARLRRLTGGL